MADPATLDDGIYDQLTALSAQGDALAEQQDFDAALAAYQRAWDLLPSPKNIWEAATWLQAAIGDVFFLSGRMAEAREAFAYAMTCPDAIGNPFLHLRLGQTLLETGEPDRAADELIRAYMAEGADIFNADDAKYLEFLRTRAVID